jgi:plasmid stabilization system protein ParE
VTPRLVFLPTARTDLRETRRHYEARVSGLGRAFVAEVEATVALLVRFPSMYPVVEPEGHVHRALLHRFPYALLYEALPDGRVLVLSCRHVRAEPPDWTR